MAEEIVVLKLLAVHDDGVLLNGIRRVLTDFSLEVGEARAEVLCTIAKIGAGTDAVGLVRAHAPDIMIVDAKLPGQTGLDLLQAVHDPAGEMLPIMLMADGSVQTVAAAARQGVFAFLPKPFTAADLRHAVRQAAERLILVRRARQLEQEKRRVRFDFIRVLGHELKAPLGAVSMNIGVIKGHHLGADVTAYDDLLGRCEVRLDQMQKLIVDLLDVTRLESGQKQRTLAACDLHQAAADAIDLAAAQAAPRGISIRLDGAAPLPFLADRGEIDMILNNLLSNAVKYNRDGGDVCVTLSGDEHGVSIAVRDTGIGMTPAEVEKLFGEFVRIKNRKTANILGSGLGLSILKRLVELYNGRVTVESEPDVGSTFTVFLAASAASADAEPRAGLREGEPR